MKALMYRGPGQIHCESVSDPELPNAQGAIVRTTICAICGSDLHPYHKDFGAVDYCIGHEAVGEVIEVGREVNRFAVGDRVLLCGVISCGTCVACRVGNSALCATHRQPQIYGQGQAGLGGFQAQAVAIRLADHNLWRLPDKVSDEAGIMLSDNLGTAWYCARRARVGPGDVVAVIGMGAVGLSAVMAALAMGAERVFAMDLIPSRRQAAARLGAETIEDADVVQAVRELTGGRGADVVLDANGGAITTKLAIRMVARGGRVSTVGMSEDFMILFPILTALAKNIEFSFVKPYGTVHLRRPVLSVKPKSYESVQN